LGNCGPRSPLTRGGGIVILTTLKVPKTGGIPTTKASVLRWLKSEGDSVRVGEAIVELETEKVSYELESPIAGVLLKIVAGESVQVPVGGNLCHIGQPGDVVP
jgi:pyruvate/2-oxoglutarate dehydrogenase complex dihydrolipoamide acyltransferase (E2) component